MQATAESHVEAMLRRPADLQGDDEWAVIILPKTASDAFPRRGRTSMQGSINGHPFEATLEPDGQLSHWFKVPEALMQVAGVAISVTACQGDLGSHHHHRPHRLDPLD